MKAFSFAVLAVACAQPLFACDLCAIYSAAESRGELGTGIYAGLAEQFTHFGTLQEDGVKVPNTDYQSEDSSITQILLGYNFTERFGVQFTAPFIHRAFRRSEAGVIEEGNESGLGDVSLVAHFQPIRHETMNTTFAWNLLGGIKMPTGDSSRIAEELSETPPPYGAVESGIHGHDLALGSGSWDGIVGTSIYARWKRAFFSAATQYSLRTRGDFDYQYANDLTWSGGPGVLLVLDDLTTLSLQANVSGETKGLDNLAGTPAEDTGITSVFLGPELQFEWRGKLSAELGADFPVSIDNTALQIVPDWRVRAAFTWHF
ncbi:MAG: hypothetical protein EPO07_20605 [Verrucomicrobia bacterium]|nr:MAG: hypothetical protein EPO07_20605 [Verrucomicrobiota bacterium]